MNLLLVTSRFPWPPRRGDRMRALQVASLLAEEHEVVLLVPEPAPAPGPDGEGGEADGASAVPADLPFRVETYATRRRSAARGVARAVLSGSPWQSGLFRQPDLSRRLAELAPQADLAILQLVRLAGHAGDLGETPFLVDLIDSLSLNFERRARYESVVRAPVFAAEARRLAAAEADLVSRSAGAFLVCDRDRHWLADRLPPEAAGRLHTVSLHVDVPADPPERQPPSPPRLALTGNLGYFPTVDGVTWFFDQVWPALRRDHPDLTLVLAGARPASALRRAARAADGVDLLDTPPDLAPILAGATAAIAPMRAGSGVPVKILEAWSAGVPVLASPWAAAGASARPGFDLLVADTPDQWRTALTRLLQDPTLPPRLTRAGHDHLRQHHSETAVRQALRTMLSQASTP